jgi:stage II sporulation protein M
LCLRKEGNRRERGILTFVRDHPGWEMKNLFVREWEFFRGNLANIFVWLVFFSGLATGLVYYSLLHNPDALARVFDAIKNALEQKGLLGLAGKSPFRLAYKIFLNNLQATAVFTALGLIPFFLGTGVFVSSVAVLLGATLALTVSEGLPTATFIKLTAPHGVVELAAVFYGASLGVLLSKKITRKLLARLDPNPVSGFFLLKKVLGSYALLVLPLLALAALIESFVTPLLM